MTVTTVNPKGQVTIPQELRDRYGFAPGTKVTWLERDGQVIPIPLVTLMEMQGLLAPPAGEPPLTKTLLEERRAARTREDG